MEDPHWNRDKCEEEGDTERNGYELSTTPIPRSSSLCLLGWGRGRGDGNDGVKMRLEK